MEFVIKTLQEKFSINEVVNIHFFKFKEEFSTNDDSHPFSELVFVSKGILHISSDEYTGNLNKGEMIIHPANALHSLACNQHSNPTVIIIGFKCRADSLLYFSNHVVKLSDNNIKLLSDIIKEGRNVFCPPYDKPTFNMKKREHQPYGAEHLLKISIERFLISIIREYMYVELEEKKHFSFSINEIINYIDQNFLEKITIDELAFLFKTNRSDLCKAFKSATNKTIVQYTTDKKVELAKNLIAGTSKSFNTISEELHFDSPSHFSRFMITKIGESPKQFRERNQNH